MKYYYKDKLIRTSDNDYKYSAIYEEKDYISSLGCSAKYENAQKIINRYINDWSKELKWYEEIIRNWEKGIYHVYAKYGKVELTQEKYLKAKEHQIEYQNKINDFIRNTKVVEIEVR